MSQKKQRAPISPPATPEEYPTASERERILQRRFDLMEKMVRALMTLDERGQSRRMPELIREYGEIDFELVMNAFAERTATSYLTDASAHYRTYRQAFARFGGNRRFLFKSEYEDLSLEYAKLFGAGKLARIVRFKPNHPRQRELEDLLLFSSDLWQDITPPSIPPQPPDYQPPSPRHYSAGAQAILSWGADLDDRLLRRRAHESTIKALSASEMLALTFDPGLLDGWPGEAQSWAPYHALHLLGFRSSREVAGQLLPLLDQPNDWLSDRLPGVWAQMGPQAQLPLWKYLAFHSHSPEQRGVTLEALRVMAETHPTQRTEIIARLTRRLKEATKEDAKVNAYIIFVLNRLQALGSFVEITDAFDQDKVDLEVIRREDFDFAG
jgi:hypothetical protein